MSDERKYYRFREENEHEGETWNFYIPLNEAELALVKKAVKDAHDFYEGESPYALNGKKTYTESEVDFLLREGNVYSSDDRGEDFDGECDEDENQSICGYYPEFNKCDIISSETLEKLSNGWHDDDDFFYKAQSWTRLSS